MWSCWPWQSPTLYRFCSDAVKQARKYKVHRYDNHDDGRARYEKFHEGPTRGQTTTSRVSMTLSSTAKTVPCCLPLNGARCPRFWLACTRAQCQLVAIVGQRNCRRHVPAEMIALGACSEATFSPCERALTTSSRQPSSSWLCKSCPGHLASLLRRRPCSSSAAAGQNGPDTSRCLQALASLAAHAHVGGQLGN